MVDDELIRGSYFAIIHIDVPTSDEPDWVANEQSPTLIKGEAVGMYVIGEQWVPHELHILDFAIESVLNLTEVDDVEHHDAVVLHVLIGFWQFDCPESYLLVVTCWGDDLAMHTAIGLCVLEELRCVYKTGME